MRTVFGGRFEIGIREASSNPLGLGGGGVAVVCVEVVECLLFGVGRNAAARVEITSSTSMTTTSRRAATQVA
jgi:hypothetical protein